MDGGTVWTMFERTLLRGRDCASFEAVGLNCVVRRYARCLLDRVDRVADGALGHRHVYLKSGRGSARRRRECDEVFVAICSSS
ncbi:MAG: hypothetical protein Udaeo2_15040 [Candidatus Udaeobacter sp.]|nr:MAG: hypothetical protein Udaeo2_15040 [Candidatus Udaeobacter sp.]